ncbi:MAG: hypothetical protein M1837_004537 [Sclerophora amabilis]|nr:MAG: hypothetical protein M1837_004537 [Sclerophora amabilis]
MPRFISPEDYEGLTIRSHEELMAETPNPQPRNCLMDDVYEIHRYCPKQWRCVASASPHGPEHAPFAVSFEPRRTSSRAQCAQPPENDEGPSEGSDAVAVEELARERAVAPRRHPQDERQEHPRPPRRPRRARRTRQKKSAKKVSPPLPTPPPPPREDPTVTARGMPVLRVRKWSRCLGVRTEWRRIAAMRVEAY